MERVEQLEVKVNDHEKRIVVLERNDATTAVQIENMCGQVSSLTKVLWALVAAIFSTLIGFFFWYIQSIPR